jgi:C-3',4' desaturase CrtD
MDDNYDIIIFGGGISGFATALRLQNDGFKTLVLEAHGQLGGCAGYFTKQGFSFDVGATTLVDFVEGGVGGNFFRDINLPLPQGEYLDYIAWLPDRQITLYKDSVKWKNERLEKLGSTRNHLKFWELMDKTTDVFWSASRNNIKLPIESISDLLLAIHSIGLKNIYLTRYLNQTMLDVLKQFDLENDNPLKGLLSMLIEDTVHSTIDNAPFINAALGTTIRGAGLMRTEGGMKGFWEYVSSYYLSIGGTIKKGNKVLGYKKTDRGWTIATNKAVYNSKKIISSLPIDLTYNLSPHFIKSKLERFIVQNEKLTGGAIVIFLGVPETEVSNQELNHHQLLYDYNKPLGNGNNMFISVSRKDDIKSAPKGFRAVMISTHCSLSDWQNLTDDEYDFKKQEIGGKLLKLAKRVYPNLGDNFSIYEIGTPKTYQKYTQRTNGAVGGFVQTLKNSNFRGVPQNIRIKDFWLVGDNTWPGLGTVAGLISSKITSQYAKK